MRGFGLSVTVMAAMLALSSGVFAEDAKPDATLELTQESVALILGYTWGGGTLTFEGKSHRVAVDGVSVLALGITRAKAIGEVFNLKRIGTEATRIGNDARQRADAAAARGEAVDGRVTKVLANRLVRTQVQEFRVTFEVGRAELSSGAQQTLETTVRLLADNATYTADVVGHTDDVGAAGSNVTLSWRREEAVRRSMVERGAALNRFSFIGLGENRATASGAAGRAQDRYVRVIVFRPAD